MKSNPVKVAQAYFLKKAQKRYYWSPSEPGFIPIGYRVPPARITLPSNPETKKLEEIFEEVRKRNFPDRPSRIGARFVCPVLAGFCNPQKPGKRVYEVAVFGKRFETDAEFYTEARIDLFHGQGEERIASWARNYWKGKRGFKERLR